MEVKSLFPGTVAPLYLSQWWQVKPFSCFKSLRLLPLLPSFGFFKGWSIIALPCCVSFCYATEVNRSCVCTYPLHRKPPATSSRQHTPLGYHRALSSLCSKAGSHQLPISHRVLYICWAQSPSVSHPPLPRLCPYICFLHLCLHSYPANSFIWTHLLD